MAAEKRKATFDAKVSKKARTTSKDEVPQSARPVKTKDEHNTERKPVAKSVLLQEEKSFPRGGASVLSPLEQKQIRAQAERDVLFEQQTGKKAPRDDDGEALLSDEETSAAPAVKKSKKRAKSASSGAEKEHAIRIHGLSYKTLVPGSVVLGRVVAITSKDIALALPNNLTGYVPITAISAALNKRIEALLDDDTADPEDDIELNKLFFVGQWLRASVITTGANALEDAQSNKRHIELSIEPQQVNAQLEVENVVVHSYLQASIRSIEDHGLIMDLGISSTGSKGFIGKKELGHAYQISKLEVGQVMLCLVTGKGSDGKVLKLTPDATRFSALQQGKQSPTLSDVPNVDALLPGTAVDVLITGISAGGLTSKIMGMVDAVADALHSGAGQHTLDDFLSKHKVGSKTKARIIWSLPTDDGSRRIGISLLQNLLILSPATAHLGSNPADRARKHAKALEQSIPLSTIFDNAIITGVATDRGVYFHIPDQSDDTTTNGFAHISQLSDTRVDDISSTSGKYKVGSRHRTRVTGFNPIDGLYYLSLKPSILAAKFLRLEDLQIGRLVEGSVDRIIQGGPKGITGVLIKLDDNLSALVPSLHMSDVTLSNPERKFRENFPVKGRVLSIDLDKRQVRVTLKKTLVGDTTSAVWKAYEDIEEGQEAKGTVIKLLDKAAIVQYYGFVRGYLPISEMSESFVEDTDKHFKLGQTVTTRALTVNAEAEQLRVTCKISAGMDEVTRKLWDTMTPGQVVGASITAVLADKVEVELDGGIQGIIRVGHLVDGSTNKAESMLKKFRVGQKLTEVVVLTKLERSSKIMLSYKPSFVADAKTSKLICSFEDAQVGRKTHGYVQTITPESVYVEFANSIVALLPKAQLTPEAISQSSFGLRKDQTINVWVLNIDVTRRRFALSMREPSTDQSTSTDIRTKASISEVSNAVDDGIKTTADLALNKITKARVAAIKNTQLNVRLADNVHGRIDVSEVFDDWNDIAQPKMPLSNRFKIDDVVDVKVLGIRDARGYHFLPISHRAGNNAVVELSAKPSRLEHGSTKLLDGLHALKEGDMSIGFINNIMDDCAWVNLSPGIRGRIALMDLSDDINQLQDVAKTFQPGTALRVRVTRVDAENGKLDLSARQGGENDRKLALETLSVGEILPGRVTKSTANAVVVHLGDGLAAPVPLTELADDYDEADPTRFPKNEIVRVRVLGVDPNNKRVFLSMRPSLVLSSGLPVKDVHLSSVTQLKPSMLVRGFVKHIGEKGVVVSLSGNVDAIVRVRDLSDEFIKDWKSHLQIDQLVHARVLEVDASAKHVLLSLKASAVDANYTAPTKIEDLQAGDVVTGKVRKVEDFGVFIDIDKTSPRLSGLAHRSEIAERRIADVRGLYSSGDIVKAKVLSVDVESRKISLGLKASYFKDTEDDGADDDSAEDVLMVDGSDVEDEDEDEDQDGGIDLSAVEDLAEDVAAPELLDLDDPEQEEQDQAHKVLSTSGFDWTGVAMDITNNLGYESEPEMATKKKRRAKSEIKVDMTGDLDRYGPRSTSDFERQLLGQPNDSGLWIQYMAFHLGLSELEKAREIAERALRTIHIRDIDEKANVWIALLNLEIEYGDDDSIEETFKRACQVQEPLGMHEKLASIYIDSGKHDKADAVFERMVANKDFRASPDVWLNYATFLLSKLEQPDRAHALLPRALKSVPQPEHRLLTAKFAALEFRTSAGDAERGRTIFEGIMSEWPKWTSGWDMWVDIERVAVKSNEAGSKDAAERVRKLYERMGEAGMKKRRAKLVFKKWLEFEEAHGDGKQQERVKSLAKEFVERLQAKGDADE